jgi:hypothetical protein
MKAFATVLMLGGLMLASVPHLLCPITCAKAEGTVSQTQKCPHCGHGNSRPRQAPPKDCSAGCCDHVDAIPSTSHTVDLAPRTQVEFWTLDLSVAEGAVAMVAADRNAQSPPTAFSAHPGCALPVLLGHLLL